MQKNDQPAFPGVVYDLEGKPINHLSNPGLSVRQYAAIHLMASIAANPKNEIMSHAWKAEQAVKLTDELFKALNKPTESE